MSRRVMAVVIVVGGILLGTGLFTLRDTGVSVSSADETEVTTTTTPPPPIGTTTSTEPPVTVTTTTEPSRPEGAVPGWTVGEPWGTTVGLTMFRGNPSRSFYGTGPLPTEAPSILWRYPEHAMCGSSTVGGETKLWCGTGWTGQPAVWERPDGITEVVFGAYDKAVHFVDAATGLDTRAPFPTGDIIKGSLTVDPDGYPLVYTGSRDNKLRIIALDREPVQELWSLDAHAVAGIWNDDWDGNPVVVDDMLYEGGENGWFYAIRLHRRIVGGLVTVSPETIWAMPGWTADEVARVGRNVSIESSVAIHDRTVYFTNSGGRVVGVDMDLMAAGADDPVVFDFWAGDDIDATPVLDAEGMLYIGIELERFNDRAAQVGQLISLDPARPDAPLRWGVAVPGVAGSDGGIWATPAVADGVVYAATHTGRLMAVDAASGEITWEDTVGFHDWSSPVVVDGRLLVGTCETAELRSYRLDDPARPEPEWSMTAAEGCIESTPAVWSGRIYVGSRDGYVRAYG